MNRTDTPGSLRGTQTGILDSDTSVAFVRGRGNGRACRIETAESPARLYVSPPRYEDYQPSALCLASSSLGGSQDTEKNNMSHRTNTDILENAWADFDLKLSQDKFSECRIIQDNLGELGFESDALRMHRIINSAMANQTETEDLRAGEYSSEEYRPEYPRE